jgi:hypothetical protein
MPSTKVIARRENDTDLREYARRDSAISVLRKMGIDKANYNLFITSASEGNGVILNCKAASDSLLKPAEVVKATRAKKVPVRIAYEEIKPERMKPKPRTGTVSHVTRELILAGKTNTEVWEVIKKQFNLEDTKRSYPAWYRSDMKRREKKDGK